MKRKRLYVILGAVGALVLLLGALGGASIVFADEPTPEAEDDGPRHGIWDWGRGLFAFGRGGEWTMFDTVAEALGLTPQELFTELHGGKSLAEVAEAQGVEMETVQEALSAVRDEAMRESIEQAVGDGKMSQEQADWMLEGLEKGYMPRGHGFGRGPGHGPGMRGGFGGFAPDGFGPGGIAPQSAPSAPAVPSSSSL